MDYNKHNLSKLKSYNFTPQLEEILKHQLKDSTKGMCLALLGNEGIDRDKIINNICSFLHDTGKIKEYNYDVMIMDKIPTYFWDKKLYVLVNVKDSLKVIEKKDNDTKKECDSIYGFIKKLTSEYMGKYIIFLDTEKNFKKFLEIDSKLQFIFSDIVKIRDMTNTEILLEVKQNLSSHDEYNEDKVKEYINKYRHEIAFQNKDLALFIANYMNLHNNNLPPATRSDTSQNLLENIVGLNSIKEQINSFKAYLEYKKQAIEKGVDLPEQHLHMLFLGNPGTGKTTVARVIAQILFDIGICKQNKLVEVSRKDLVGEYIGHTAPKIAEAIEKAMGGVLFIDEAYSLSQSDYGRDFGNEAVATLIKEMEDNKDNLVVIFAGYTKEMTQFVQSNSGIASRIGYTFEFQDYTEEELYQIFEKKMSQFIILDDAIEPIKSLIAYFHNLENFGNGRFVDKLIQNILIKHSKNFTSIKEISKNDIPTISEMSEIVWKDESRCVLPENLTEEDYLRTSYHEVGHALLSYLENKNSGIEKITIRPEATGTLGYVQYKKEDKLAHDTLEAKKKYVKRLLAGRGAEEVFFGKENVSTGCWSDLQKATNVLLNTHQLGLSKSFGLLSPNSLYSKEQIAEKMNDEVREMLDDLYAETVDTIKEHKNAIEEVAKILMERKTMDGDELNNILEKVVRLQQQESSSEADAHCRRLQEV